MKDIYKKIESNAERDIPFEFTILGSCGDDGTAQPSKRLRRQQTKPRQLNLLKPTAHSVPFAERSKLNGRPVAMPLGSHREATGREEGGDLLASEADLTDIDAAMRAQGFR